MFFGSFQSAYSVYKQEFKKLLLFLLILSYYLNNRSYFSQFLAGSLSRDRHLAPDNIIHNSLKQIARRRYGAQLFWNCILFLSHTQKVCV